MKWGGQQGGEWRVLRLQARVIHVYKFAKHLVLHRDAEVLSGFWMCLNRSSWDSSRSQNVGEHTRQVGLKKDEGWEGWKSFNVVGVFLATIVTGDLSFPHLYISTLQDPETKYSPHLPTRTLSLL